MPKLVKLSRKKVAKRPHVRWEAMSEFLAFADIEVLTPIQRVAYLALFYSNSVAVVGHSEYFPVAENFAFNQDEIIGALRTVGAIEQVSVLTAAHAAVIAASERAPEKYSNRYQAGVEFADLLEFDDAFERCGTSVDAYVSNYIDKHEGEFIEWKP